MTTRPHEICMIAARLTFALAILAPLAIPACSSDSSGLRVVDGGGTSIDGQQTGTPDSLGGAGGSVARLDARTQGSDSAATGDAGSTGGAGGFRPGDAGPAPGIDSRLTGSGGSAGLDAAGLGGRTDAGTSAADAPLDAPTSDVRTPADLPAQTDSPANDAAADGPLARTDSPTIDESKGCGDVGEPCCTQRTCNTPNLVCTSSGGGQGTCALCGGAGEACCEGDVCTAPGTTCSGTGRNGGTCR